MLQPTQPKQERPRNPNLISPNEILSTNKLRVVEKVLKTSGTVLVLVQFFTLFLVIRLIVISTQVQEADKKLSAQYKEVLSLGEFERDVKKLQKKINAFKLIREQNLKVQDKVDLVYKSTPYEIELLGMGYEGGAISLILKTQKGEYFTKFISSFLQSGKVSFIALTRALYRTDTDYYDFEVTIYLK
ncbi:MAG: hypothetical protein AAB443_03315 [Patescibacteria group bacterium]